MKVLLLLIFLISSSFPQTCIEMNSNYIRHLNNFIKMSTDNTTEDLHKKSLISMIKSYQDDLIKDCNGLIDLKKIQQQETTINQIYKSYYND